MFPETTVWRKTERDYGLHVGISASDDAFYGETPEHIQMLFEHKLVNVEMEASAIFTIAHLRGLKAAMVCGVSGNLVTAEVEYEDENKPLIKSWDDAIAISLDAIYRYEQGSLESRL